MFVLGCCSIGLISTFLQIVFCLQLPVKNTDLLNDKLDFLFLHDRYLDTVRPLLTPEEYKETESVCQPLVSDDVKISVCNNNLT